MGEECSPTFRIGGPPPGCCGGLECNRKGGYSSRDQEMAGGMGVCEKPRDEDEDEEEAKVRAKVY